MARLPDIESEQSKLTTVLRAMSNAKRMRILNELSDGRERSVSELEGVIASLSQSPPVAASCKAATRQHRPNKTRIPDNLLLDRRHGCVANPAPSWPYLYR